MLQSRVEFLCLHAIPLTEAVGGVGKVMAYMKVAFKSYAWH